MILGLHAACTRGMSAPDRIAVHGHRGARARLPENTIPAFLHAIAAGADYIELDVVATADDVLVVCHDPVLRRRIFSGPRGSRVVRDMDLQQLREWECGARRNRRFRRQAVIPGLTIPTLDEVFGLSCRGAFGFNIEVKTTPQRPDLTPAPERFAGLLVALILKHRLERRVIVQSFDFGLLAAVRRLAPELPMSGLAGIRRRDLVAIARAAHTPIVGPYHRVVNRTRVDEAHAAGVGVIPWTANRPRDWERLIRAGVDGIITDDPAGLIEYLRTR